MKSGLFVLALTIAPLVAAYPYSVENPFERYEDFDLDSDFVNEGSGSGSGYSSGFNRESVTVPPVFQEESTSPESNRQPSQYQTSDDSNVEDAYVPEDSGSISGYGHKSATVPSMFQEDSDSYNRKPSQYQTSEDSNFEDSYAPSSESSGAVSGYDNEDSSTGSGYNYQGSNSGSGYTHESASVPSVFQEESESYNRKPSQYQTSDDSNVEDASVPSSDGSGSLYVETYESSGSGPGFYYEVSGSVSRFNYEGSESGSGDNNESEAVPSDLQKEFTGPKSNGEQYQQQTSGDSVVEHSYVPSSEDSGSVFGDNDEGSDSDSGDDYESDAVPFVFQEEFTGPESNGEQNQQQTSGDSIVEHSYVPSSEDSGSVSGYNDEVSDSGSGDNNDASNSADDIHDASANSNSDSSSVFNSVKSLLKDR